MPNAKQQLKNSKNKSNLKNHDSLKKAYALKNNGDFNPNKYHDLSNIIESGDYGLDVLGNTISDQVIPAKLINFANQTQDNTKSEWVNGANMGLELLKNTSPFIADLGINTLQKLTTHLGNKNPEGIDRAYKNYFNNEKGAKYSNGGWLDNLPNQYAEGGSLSDDPTKPYNAVTNPDGYKATIYVDPNDLLGMQRYNAYKDSSDLANLELRQKADIERNNNKDYTLDRKLDGVWDRLTRLNNKHPSPIGIGREKVYIGDDARGNRVMVYPEIYKKPIQPYAIKKIEPRVPYSSVKGNLKEYPNTTVQLPISNIPLQQMPTIGIGEPTFEGNNSYWKKQDNQLIRQNNDYSNNMNLPISNKPGDRFHQEPSWMVGDDRYYERDGEAYMVPQPEGGWKNKQTLDASSGKWKSSIVKKANGGWLDEYSDGGSLTGPGKLLNRSRKEIIKQRELEENLRKEGFNEDGVFTRVLPEYTVKSPEKKLYDEAYNKSIAQQQAFQNSWYPGSTDPNNPGYAPGVMDNINQRAGVKGNDAVAKNLVNNNKIGDLKDYQKDYIATSNYSGKLRPNIGTQFNDGIIDIGGFVTGVSKSPTEKSLGILAPLEYPVNLVRGTVKGEGVDALKGEISSPWLDANDVDPGAVNEVGIYNTMADLALDPLNFSGTGALLGKTGIKGLKKTLNQIDLKALRDVVDDVAIPIRYRKDIKELKNQKIQSENFWKSEEGRKRLQNIGIDADKIVPYDLTFNPNIGSYYYGPGNQINIDFKQLRKLKKDRLELSPKTVLGHEEGHYIQREKYRMNDYLDDVKAYQVRLADYEKNVDKHIKKSKSIYSNPLDFLNLDFKPYPPVLTSQPTQTDDALKFLKADPNVIKNLVNKEIKSIGLPENSLDYWHYDSDVERFAHLREMRQNMVNKNVIKNLEDPITEDMIMNFANQSKGDRISSFVEKSPNNLKFLAREVNKAPALVPIGIGAGVGAGVLQQKKNGGWLDNL